MNTPDEEQLECWLRESRPEPIADNGFSTKVLAALPPRVAARPAISTRAMAIGLGAIAGVIVVLARGVRLEDMDAAGRQLAQLSTEPRVVFTLLAALATIVFIYLPAFRRRGV